jgi:mycofactocin precursor
MSQSSQAPATELDAVIEEDTLVEEVSIDGMCGVY